MKHLTKLFDSMAKLKFEMDADNQPKKSAIGMYSKDGEYVNLEKPCDLNGQVGHYIQAQLLRVDITTLDIT
jgi:dynein heavy chain